MVVKFKKFKLDHPNGDGIMNIKFGKGRIGSMIDDRTVSKGQFPTDSNGD